MPTKTEKKAAAETLRREAVALFGRIAAGDKNAYTIAWGIADTLTRQLTACESFTWLIDSTHYTPTLRADAVPAAGVLADYYDFFQARFGRPNRAFRSR
jgi:hypothetical protein